MHDGRRRPTSRARGVLATLSLGMVVMGSTELLAVGVLDLVAADLAISVPAAGSLVTAYALGLAVGGPLLTAASVTVDRRTVLLGALALFVVATGLGVLAGGLAVLLAARVATGALQGVFIAAAFTVGTAVVPEERAGRAIAVVMAGVTVSGALGAPLGALAGPSLGWRGTFAAAAGLAVIALVAASVLVPSVPGGGGGAARQARHALAPPVLAVLALTALVFASVYAALTYVVPFLRIVTGVSGGATSLFLLAYGAAAAVGSLCGGRFADRNAARTLVVGTAGVAASLLVLRLTGTVPVLVAVALLAVGLFAMGMAPSMQVRVVSLAGRGAALAQSLPASAANLGIALGSVVGGVAVGSLSTADAVTAGLVVALVALPVAWATSVLRPPAPVAPSARHTSRSPDPR